MDEVSLSKSQFIPELVQIKLHIKGVEGFKQEIGLETFKIFIPDFKCSDSMPKKHTDFFIKGKITVMVIWFKTRIYFCNFIL